MVIEAPELVEKFRVGLVQGLDLSPFNIFHPSFTQDALLMTMSETRYRFLSDPFDVRDLLVRAASFLLVLLVNLFSVVCPLVF